MTTVPPRMEGAFKHPRLTVPSADRGPEVNPIQENTTHRTSEWPAPRRPQKPQGLPEPPAWPLRNRFTGLPEEVVEEDSAYS